MSTMTRLLAVVSTRACVRGEIVLPPAHRMVGVTSVTGFRPALSRKALVSLPEESFARPTLAPEQVGHPRPHVVSNFAHARDGLSFWILERPVVPAEPRHDRALFTATHRDQHLGAPGQIVGQLPRSP